MIGHDAIARDERPAAIHDFVIRNLDVGSLCARYRVSYSALTKAKPAHLGGPIADPGGVKYTGNWLLLSCCGSARVGTLAPLGIALAGLGFSRRKRAS